MRPPLAARTDIELAGRSDDGIVISHPAILPINTLVAPGTTRSSLPIVQILIAPKRRRAASFDDAAASAASVAIVALLSGLPGPDRWDAAQHPGTAGRILVRPHWRGQPRAAPPRPASSRAAPAAPGAVTGMRDLCGFVQRHFIGQAIVCACT